MTEARRIVHAPFGGRIPTARKSKRGVKPTPTTEQDTGACTVRQLHIVIVSSEDICRYVQSLKKHIQKQQKYDLNADCPQLEDIVAS